MNKREAVLSLLDFKQKPAYVPAAFFLHFGTAYQQGKPAVDKHLEYFHYTGMDFVKIQYEHSFPKLSFIQRPEDWANTPVYKEDFFAEPLQVVEGLVKAAQHEALVVMTLYSPFMLAGQSTSDLQLTRHIKENPEAVKKGLEKITQSLLNFVRGCIRMGLDGFYTSTQGGEAFRFPGTDLFERCVKPFDLAIWSEIQPVCKFNILHVCDYVGRYDDYTPFLDYPGHIVNCSLNLGSRMLTGEEVSRMFNRPFMGGMDRKGVIASGSQEQIVSAVDNILSEAPEQFILAADCTVPSETPWDNLRTAIDTAHQYVK